MELNEKELAASADPVKPEEKGARTTENQESESRKCCISTEKIILIGIIAAILAIILVLVLCLTLIKKEKKKEVIEEETLYKENKEKYIVGTYNSQKGIPLKLFNPSSLGLNNQGYSIEDISTNNTRRLKQVAVYDGVLIPEETGKIQIKISFNTPLTSLDFMFEGCADLVKVNLTNLNSPSITSMIYTFTDCISLETVDLTSFPSAHIKKMDFLFSGCINLVSIKGFETLDTSSLEKTAGMFLDCQNLISVNLSSLYLDNITESNGMFINNPSLELLDLGNVTDVNGLFSSTEFFKVTIISSSMYVNTTCLKGIFSIINRAANQRLNCSVRNWTDFIMKHLDPEYIYQFLPENFTQIIKQYENYYLGKNLYDELIKIKYLDCNSFNNTFLYFNHSECEKYKRLYIDFLNENEKCIECDDEEGRSLYCKKCSKGYYLPKSNDYIPTRCKRCDEGCLECIADDESGKSICLKCKENNYDVTNYEFDSEYDNQTEYKLYNGKCIKKCEIGINEKCQSCKEENGKYDECLTCNEGYYYDINYDKGICRKIEIENCIQAIKEYNTVKCVKCIDGYLAHNGQCEKGCELGEDGNSCASCNLTYEFRESCASCHPGYYLLPNGPITLCSNCYEDSLGKNNCTECEYISGEIKCTSCDSNSFLSDGKCIISCTENCLNCSYENEKWLCAQCKDKYFLNKTGEGKICQECPDECKNCLRKDMCTECLEEYKLINGYCEKYCTIGTNSQCMSCDFDEKNKCKDCNSGYYLPTSNSMDRSFCYNCGEHCLSCYGERDYPRCTQCIDGFYVSNSGICNSCGSPRIKKCHQGNGYDIIVDECYSDYILFKNNCIEKCNTSNYLSKCSVCNEESDKLYQCKTCKEGYYLPTNLDNIYCYNCPNNCKSCEGSNDAPICTSCYDDYILSGGKCLKNCNTGNNELCKNCNTEQGKIDKCQDCNDGYYLSNNNDQTQCSLCPNNCQKCNGIDNYNVNCTECDTGYYLAQNEVNQYSYYYNPIFFYTCLPCNMTGCRQYKTNSNTCICIDCISSETERIKNGDMDNEYKSCYGRCEIGELDKCKTCGNNIGECGECNEGYFLNSEGKCIIDFHLIAKYKTTTKNEFVTLIYYYILNMTINGTVINNPQYYYTFPLPGEHLIYIKFSIDVYFPHLFEDIKHLTYIKFLPKAKELYISLMNDFFSGCINLEYADISNLNLKNNGCFMNFFKNNKKLKEVIFPSEPFSNIYWFYRMFYGCESLTSIDLSNIHNTNGEYYYEMFYGCKKLKSINLGGFNRRYYGSNNYDMFINVPKDAKIIIHENFYNSISGQLNGFKNITIKN